MNFCLCSWLYALSVSRCAEPPFWPSQSAYFLSALYDQNDQKPFSWAWSKFSTVQAATKGSLVLLFNKKKKTLEVFGEELSRRCSDSFICSLFQRTAFILNYLLAVCVWFVLCRLFQQGGFQTHSMFLECKLLFRYTQVRARTHALFRQHSTVCVVYKARYFSLITVV